RGPSVGRRVVDLDCPDITTAVSPADHVEDTVHNGSCGGGRRCWKWSFRSPRIRQRVINLECAQGGAGHGASGDVQLVIDHCGRRVEARGRHRGSCCPAGRYGIIDLQDVPGAVAVTVYAPADDVEFAP